MTIAETVRQGQDTLARMGLGKERVDRKWDIAVTLQEVRLQYPRSLGEVCLEEAEDSIRRWNKHRNAWHRFNIREDPFHGQQTMTGELSAEDMMALWWRGIQALRRAMWHWGKP
jgi:hypothetical protein